MGLELDQKNEQDTRTDLVQRISRSQCFRGSARLREFLTYVADCEVRNAPHEATEQQIGIHVFGRKAGYNSSEDSIVRTHARLLRQKLAEYFSTEGVDEPVLIQIPKGHYLPVFNPRAASAAYPEQESPPTFSVDHSVKTAESPMPWWAYWVAVTLILCLVGGSAWWVHPRQAPPVNLVDQFWKPFLANNSSLVIYSNALFTGDSKNGLRYAPDAHMGEQPDDLVDTYTGVGELAGIYELTRLFDSHHATFTLKRSLLVTWDEAKLQNLIFVGSVAENSSLREVPSTTEFTLTTGNGYSGVVNHHPRPGEQAIYSVPLHSANKDYAILAYLPGEQTGRYMLVFSGLMTLGTQAAVDFTCQSSDFEQLLRQTTTDSGEIRPFEAVLETTIVGGVPLQTKLVTLHTR